MRHEQFEDEYSHFARDTELGLAELSAAVSPTYTLVDRRAVREPTISSKREYRGRYLNGSESEWVMEAEALDSLTPPQLDVLHAMWELHKGTTSGPRPPTPPSRQKRSRADEEREIKEVLVGTSIWRNFMNHEGRTKFYKGAVFGYKTPYFRVCYPDREWEELTRAEKGNRNKPLHGGTPMRKSRNSTGRLA